MSALLFPRKQHDSLARYVFGRPRAAAIVLRRVLPPPLLAALDLDSLRRLPTSTTRPAFGERDSDLLFTVGLRGIEAPPLRVALDHQSTPDDLMPWRSLVYVGEQWGSYINEQPQVPRMLPFVLPVLMVQPPAKHTPRRLSDILALPAELRKTFGNPFDVTLYIDDLSASVLDDPVADAGHLALVEITRVLLYAYKNEDSLTVRRLASLGPLFDTVLSHFGPAELTELLTYVLAVFGADSPLHTIILDTFGKATREMYVTLADDLLAKGLRKGQAVGLRKGQAVGLRKGQAVGLRKGRALGLRKGRVEAKAEAVLEVLEHRRLPVPTPIRERVLATTDEPLLQRWFHRAFSATTAAELFEG